MNFFKTLTLYTDLYYPNVNDTVMLVCTNHH